MCGIAGFFNASQSPEEGDALLSTMLQSIAHRGPDGEGRLPAREGTHGLHAGMRRLSIIDLAGGDQPIWNEERDIAVLFNGEIYNYRELRAELKAKGHSFRTESDTEVIVHLYEELGADCCRRLRGMFGICVVDYRKGEILLARDHFGQKSIYYTTDDSGDSFAFCSELKGLLTLPFVDRSRDTGSLLEFASFLSLAPPRTHFAKIKKLRAGHLLRVDFVGKPRGEQEKFWAHDCSGEPTIKEMAEATRAVDDVLQESVQLHLRSDVPVGVFLSSGLDSRLIASYAAREYGNTLQAFTVGFGEGRSEVEGAAATARDLGIQHHGLEMDADDFANSIDLVTHHLDEPVGDAAAIPLLHISRLAAESVKVILSGEGADELFAGYSERYRGRGMVSRQSDRWRSLALPLRLASLLPAERIRRLAARTAMSNGEEMVSLISSGLGMEEITLSNKREHAQMLREIATRLFLPQRDAEHAAMTLDLAWELPEWLLQKADKMSMAASLELRSPFLDTRVAEVAGQLDTALKLPPEGSRGKEVLRKIHGLHFPNAGDSPPKQGFPLPLNRWLRGPLRERIEAELFASNSPLFPTLQREQLKNLWDRFSQGNDSNGTLLYALWSYCVWDAKMPR